MLLIYALSVLPFDILRFQTIDFERYKVGLAAAARLASILSSVNQNHCVCCKYQIHKNKPDDVAENYSNTSMASLVKARWYYHFGTSRVGTIYMLYIIQSISQLLCQTDRRCRRHHNKYRMGAMYRTPVHNQEHLLGRLVVHPDRSKKYSGTRNPQFF